MNRQMISKESLRNALKSLCIALIGAVVGVGSYIALQKPVEPVIKVVYKEPTDVQLAGWWFGTTDKSKLLKRMCK